MKKIPPVEIHVYPDCPSPVVRVLTQADVSGETSLYDESLAKGRAFGEWLLDNAHSGFYDGLRQKLDEWDKDNGRLDERYWKAREKR